ncbi:MAG: matrixin family metalloprotease [Pirellulales bacterium]
MCSSARGYELQGRWSRTASNTNTGSLGTPITLTWGFVPDGTTITDDEGSSGSDLLAFLDTEFGAGGADLTQHTWFPLFEDSYNRLSQLSGLTFLYESQDSGSTINNSTFPQGSLGQQADLRVGGHSIDGQSGANTLAYNYFPNHGDLVIDTDNTGFFSNGTNNFRRLRNVVSHETGHAVGLDHTASNNSRFLLESKISAAFDGPQLDDILGLHRNYGDAWEKNGGNDVFGSATQLGSLAVGGWLDIGAHGDNTMVTSSESDFISIDDNSDLDYFSFVLTEPLAVTLNLTPRGTTYNTGPSGGTQTSWDTQSLSDLTLQLLDSNGSTLIEMANHNGAGLGESIQYALDSGTYYAQVSGVANEVQLYGLSISGFNVADVNSDGYVDSADASTVITNWGTDGLTFAEGDINGDDFIDNADAGILIANFNAGSGPSLATVPEPSSLALFLLVFCYQGTARHRQWGSVV